MLLTSPVTWIRILLPADLNKCRSGLEHITSRTWTRRLATRSSMMTSTVEELADEHGGWSGLWKLTWLMAEMKYKAYPFNTSEAKADYRLNHFTSLKGYVWPTLFFFERISRLRPMCFCFYCDLSAFHAISYECILLPDFTKNTLWSISNDILLSMFRHYITIHTLY